MKVELDLFNYTRNTDLKGSRSIATTTLVSEKDLVSLKTKADTLDKFNTVPAELIQLSEVLDNDAVKKLSIDKLVKVNVIDVNMPNTTG